MKAIYTSINGGIYKVDTPFTIPLKLVDLPSTTHSSVHTNDVMQEVTENIYINNLNTTDIKSNKDLVTQMCEYLFDKCITEIDTLSNRYKVYVDYTITDGCSAVDSHQILINDFEVTDVAIPLGVSADDELVYRQGKFLNTKVEFSIPNTFPIGIMYRKTNTLGFKVNDLVIYQDGSTLSKDVHNSICYCCYEKKGHTAIISALENYVPIFSALDHGIIFETVKINFNPRKIILDIDFIYSDLMVVYDDKEIEDIIITNIERKYNPPSPDDDPDDPDHIIPDSDIYPDADGSTCPDEHGWFDYYERCRSTTPGALLVVEDLIPDSVFDSSTMIRKKKIIKDIPDITVGDFVIYRTGLYQGDGSPEDYPCDCHGHHHHHHHHHHDNPDNTEPGSDDQPDVAPDTDNTDTTDDNISDDTTTGDDVSTLNVDDLFDH